MRDAKVALSNYARTKKGRRTIKAYATAFGVRPTRLRPIRVGVFFEPQTEAYASCCNLSTHFRKQFDDAVFIPFGVGLRYVRSGVSQEELGHFQTVFPPHLGSGRVSKLVRGPARHLGLSTCLVDGVAVGVGFVHDAGLPFGPCLPVRSHVVPATLRRFPCCCACLTNGFDGFAGLEEKLVGLVGVDERLENRLGLGTEVDSSLVAVVGGLVDGSKSRLARYDQSRKPAFCRLRRADNRRAVEPLPSPGRPGSGVAMSHRPPNRARVRWVRSRGLRNGPFAMVEHRAVRARRKGEPTRSRHPT